MILQELLEEFNIEVVHTHWGGRGGTAKRFIKAAKTVAKTYKYLLFVQYEYGEGSDYVTKPFLLLELKARVKEELQIQDMLQELKFMASTDPLTKLYNRRYFQEVSDHIFKLAIRKHSVEAIVKLTHDALMKPKTAAEIK